MEPRNRILVVDDDNTIRTLLVHALEDFGYEAASARDGREGLASATQPGKLPRLILLDIVMSGSDGVEFLRGLRAHPDPAVAAIPVVVMTGKPSAMKPPELFAPEAKLLKPFRMGALREVVEQICKDSPAPGPVPKLTRAAIDSIVRSGRLLLVQGAMGAHASDGLAGKMAAARSRRFTCVGTISGVLKTTEALRRELRRAKAAAPEGYVGVNLMAALNHDDFERLARTALEEGVSFIVQGAGISREVVRWCRDAETPFAGIVSSGRLAAMYEKWGAEFLVAEGAEAGGHIGDIDLPLPALVEEVRSHSRLPIVAAGGIHADDLGRFFALGASGVQLATRFLACSDGDVHASFKQMHLGKRADDVVIITSCVKGMKARAIRNAFTEALASGRCFPPRSKAWFFGEEGYHGRKKACVECQGAELCMCRGSDFKQSFCIADALLRGAILGDTKEGLFYTGQSVTRIPERTMSELKSVQEIVTELEVGLAGWEARAGPISPPQEGPGPVRASLD
jgi:NAD(P)H-dependent flavin oxidoreductase YrpB (nitropropane dioxygenase family)